MKPAADAIVVDSTGLTVEEVVERLAADVVDGDRPSRLASQASSAAVRQTIGRASSEQPT